MQRNLVECVLTLAEVYRRVNMRPSMLRHAKAPGSVPVTTGRHLPRRLLPLKWLVVRPEDRLLVERVSQIYKLALINLRLDEPRQSDQRADEKNKDFHHGEPRFYFGM